MVVNTSARLSHVMLPRISVFKKWRTESRSVVFSCFFTYQVKLAMDSWLHLLECHLLQPSKAKKKTADMTNPALLYISGGPEEAQLTEQKYTWMC